MTAPDETMRIHQLQDVAADGFRPTWRTKGWWSHPSHGMLAGMEKSLKSWIDAIETASVASRIAFLGHFEVVTSGPVVVFTGESGRHLYERRLRHAGRGLGMTDVQINQLPVYIIDERASTTSNKFQSTLRHALRAFEPVKVTIDPLYSYHGADVDAGNVHATGPVLNAVSDLTGEAGAGLTIVNHFRKSAAGRRFSLTDITQAGSREWVESWVLVGHRSTPKPEDVHAGHFKLDVVVGGRQWDGDRWELDIDLGQLNRETFSYSGELAWQLREPSAESIEDRRLSRSS